jgi:rhodanese-related sulfurtransferase
MSEFMQQNAVYIFMAVLIAWMLYQRVLAPKMAGVKSISAGEYMKMRDEPHTLVDVRSAGEWASGHAPKAIHIPLGEVNQRLREIREGEPVVVICASGARSSMAAVTFAKAGFKPVYNFSGGMGSWRGAGLPVK